jgi:hypothetical protein
MTYTIALRSLDAADPCDALAFECMRHGMSMIDLLEDSLDDYSDPDLTDDNAF